MNLVRHITGDGVPGGILVVGAHPKLEESTPFSTPAGYMLRKMAASLGIEHIRFEYVCERKFDRKKESLFFDKACTVPKDEFRAWASDLRRRIDEQKPKVIVALGATAMRALTSYVSIDKTHCYVIRDIANLPYPVIPAYSHNEIYRERSNAFWLRYALHKANEVLKGRTDPPQTLITNNNFQIACTFLKEILDTATEVCIDIETAGKTEELTALGISASPDKALSVSRVGDDALSPIEWDMIVQFFREIMESPKIAKIGQNFSFDALMLWRIHGIGLAGSVWDTRHAGNAIYSDLDKSLEELIRLYLYRAPHKGSWKTTGEQLRVYNAQDIITTHRIALAQRAHMAELGILEYFQSTPQALFVPALNLMKRGIKVDLHAVAQLRKQVEHYLKGMRETLGSWAQQYTPPAERNKRLRDVYADSEASFDKPVHAPTTKDLALSLKGIIPEKDIKEFYVAKPQHAKNGLVPGRIYKKAYKKATEYTAQSFNPASPSQVMSVLKNAGVKVPKSKSSQTKMWQESTNDNALKKILDRNKDPEDALEFVRNLLQYRAGNKLLTSYCKAALDLDGRWRCEYNIEGTETGRSSSKKTFWGTGGNNQNIPRDGFNGIKFKNVFVPDDNKILFQSDQSSAEARVVAYLSGSAKLIELVENDEDIHTYAISAILGRDILPLKESDPKEYKRLRQIGKVVNHGCVTGEHEVLTPNGWVRIDAWSGQEIAEWFKDGSIEFNVPVKYHVYDNAEELVKYEGQAFSIIGTKNHRMPVWKTNFSVEHLDNLTGCSNIPKGGMLVPRTNRYVDIRGVAAIQADAHINKAKALQWHIRKERKRKRLLDLFPESNVHQSGENYYTPYAQWRHLELFLLPGKEFNLPEILKLNKKAREDFLDELLLWDGCVSKRGNRKEYITTNKANAYHVQTIALVTGRSAIVRCIQRIGRKDLYTVSFNNRGRINIRCAKKSYTTADKVYCFTTSTGFFLMRHNGSIYVSGNSNYDMGPSTLADSALKQGLKMSPDEAAFFLKKRKEVFPEISEWHESIKAQLHKDRILWTPFGRRRVFLGKVNDNTYREAYAFIPQSTIPHITNLMWLWVENVAKRTFDVDVLQMGHDALLMQVAQDQVKAFSEAYILTTNSIKFTIGERTNLNIPWDAEFGYRWGSLKGLDEALRER